MNCVKRMMFQVIDMNKNLEVICVNCGFIKKVKVNNEDFDESVYTLCHNCEKELEEKNIA